jgi:Ca-activated chloride channel family protein
VEWSHPLALWFGLVLPVFAMLRWRQERRCGVAYPPLQYRRLRNASGLWSHALVPLETLIVGLAILALAGPVRTDQLESLSEHGIDLALVLDVSASMQAADFPPNRLEALKALAGDLILKGGPNRVAVYAFAGHTFTQTPLTSDRSSVLTMVQSLAYESISHSRSGGTALGDALLVAADTLVKHRIDGRDQVLILITDGESNRGADPMLGARFVRSEGLRLVVIGVGGPMPVKVYVRGEPFINAEGEHLETSLDDEQLIEIAEKAGGSYRRAEDLEVLREIFAELGRLQKSPIETSRLLIQQPLAPVISGVMLVLVALWLWLDAMVLRRPWR